MKGLLTGLCLFFTVSILAQPYPYTVRNVHSHNDYEQKIPFFLAYNEGFGSVEADIFLQDNELLVAHNTKELRSDRTLKALYLDPIRDCIAKNHGHVFPDSTQQLQLLIDVKRDSVRTLSRLVEILRDYPSLIHNPSLKFVITGSRPDESTFITYPDYIQFDGELYKNYSKEALTKIVLFSDDFRSYSHWNGKGNIPKREWAVLQAAVEKSHKLNKPVRFWDAPDFINAWYQFMHLQVDYINTDRIVPLSTFLHTLPQTSYTSPGKAYTVYQPTYRTDAVDKPVKNVILLIGDGTGLAHLYAGYTANKGALNIFKMMQIGLSKTSSFDSYVTDSAPGSTAFSSGQKTNNRYVGVDHTGTSLTLLPVLLEKRKIRTGLVTCGDIADATPADFYAHQPERDNARAILEDLKNAPIDLLMGSGHESLDNVDILKESAGNDFGESILKELQPEYKIVPSIDSVPALPPSGKKYIVAEKQAGLSMLNGRGDWLQRAFLKTTGILSHNKAGFFLMTEGAQVDYGGHAGSLPYVATEVMDFDQVVGKALEFADKNGETLVIVTADHETGGLSLLDGNYEKGTVSGQFSSNDHTAIPVPVFAYGPRSALFRGVYENTAIFSKILQAYGL
ncbi:MAG TPA: alkaline phosphatase [Puia sp.]|nr:alkaline phosphatase [Puia sp.]